MALAEATAGKRPDDALSRGVTHGTSGGRFRPDIEGLRAVAVVPILLNHVQMHGFLGGFVGVDVFFVISGYLITGILVRDVAAGRYGIAGFYRRRVLRLFPALFALLGVTTLVSAAVLTPTELVAYARSLAATLVFASNLHFYADTGYFTASAATRPLLHTWSLAVEEQFYLVWPLLIAWLVRRDGRWGTLAILVGLSAASFVASVWMVATDMAGAFYLIPFRAWELGAGGVLALALPRLARPLPRWLREGLGLAGMLAILGCVRFFKEPIDFPGLNALSPVLGTVAIIAAGPDTLVGRLLSLRPVRWIGLISYSLYLWHWPVIVFARLWLLVPLTLPVDAVILAVSVGLAALSYRVAEVGGRRWLERWPTRRVLSLAGVAIAAGVVAAGAVIALHGFPGRFDARRVALARVLDRDEEDAYRRGSCFVLDGGRFDAATCLARRSPGPTILLLGDSTAAHLWPGLARDARGYDVRQATMIGCTPKLFPDMPALRCNRFFGEMLTVWAPVHRPAAVLLAGNWQGKDVAMVRRTLVAERKRGQRIILVGPMPRYDSALPRLLFADPSGRLAQRHLDPDLRMIDQGLAQAARDTGTAYISPLALFCPGNRCRTTTDGGVPIQFDYVHLTHEGSALAVARMMPAIDAAMRTPQP